MRLIDLNSDYIQWEDVKRWCVLTDKDGNPVKDMED